MVEDCECDRLSEEHGRRTADDGRRRFSVRARGIHGFLSAIFGGAACSRHGNYRATGVGESLRGLVRETGNGIEPAGSDAGIQLVGDDDRAENRRAADFERCSACGGTVAGTRTASAACVPGATGILRQDALYRYQHRAGVAGGCDWHFKLPKIETAARRPGEKANDSIWKHRNLVFGWRGFSRMSAQKFRSEVFS